MQKKIYLILFLIFLIPFGIKAEDLSEYFTISDAKICGDDKCDIVYDENNALQAQQKFLVKMNWSLHANKPIEDGDTITVPFLNNIESEDVSYYRCGGFSWSEIYDNNGNVIGKWMIPADAVSVESSARNRVINIVFTDNAVGKTDISGSFSTPLNLATLYTYVDKVIPYSINNKDYMLKLKTYNLKSVLPSSSISNTRSSNDSASLLILAPKLFLIQLYNSTKYPEFTNDAILNNLYFELPIPVELNADIDSVSIDADIHLPTSITSYAPSRSAYPIMVNSDFVLVNQNEGESYADFKKRLNAYEYGIYKDDNSNTIVANYGSQPSKDYTYNYFINKIDSDAREPGDYFNKINSFSVNLQVKDILNNVYGSTNRIGGKIALWGMSVNLHFPAVKVPTTKKVTGTWSWVNANGETKTDQKTALINLVVPSSIATVSGSSQLLLRDFDSENEISGVTLKLQKKNGDKFEDIGEATTDSTGMIIFRNLESGTYRYVQEIYLEHYKNNSLKVYSDEKLNNIITSFEFDENVGNVVYATNEKVKYDISYQPGNHGDFNSVSYSLTYGSATPYYEAIGKDGWIFKGWSPEWELFVTESQTYTALWKKMVNVTTRYLEDGTDNKLSLDVIDTDENDTPYTTTKKEIDNYEYVRTVGDESGVRGEEDLVVTYYYKKKESTLNIKYLDCKTKNEIANRTSQKLYYGDIYDADSYESNINIPDNYIRTSANKTDNYKGIVSTNTIDVEYCYNKKDSTINSEIDNSGTNKITSSKDKVFYQIDYSTIFTDYIGDATITIVDTLPYPIEIDNSNLDGGVYNAANGTITWNINANINSYQNNKYTVTKNVELLYKNIDTTQDIMSNNVSGSTVIDNEKITVETSHNTYIDINGTINIKYIDNDSGNELLESITSIDKVGKKYELIEKEIEGYKIVDKPTESEYIYKEEVQNFEYLYSIIKYKIVTKALNEGGTITGDEEVSYKEDSKEDNINIEASDGYYISSITINDKEIKIPEKQTKLTIPNFKKMEEDKYINVSFKKFSIDVNVPDTLKKSFLKSIGIIVVLGSIVLILNVLYRRKIIFNK